MMKTTLQRTEIFFGRRFDMSCLLFGSLGCRCHCSLQNYKMLNRIVAASKFLILIHSAFYLKMYHTEIKHGVLNMPVINNTIVHVDCQSVFVTNDRRTNSLCDETHIQ